MVTPKGRPVAVNVMDHRFKRETGDVDATLSLASMLRDGQGGPKNDCGLKQMIGYATAHRSTRRLSYYTSWHGFVLPCVGRRQPRRRNALIRDVRVWNGGTPKAGLPMNHIRGPRDTAVSLMRCVMTCQSGLKICAPSSMQMYAGLERDQLLRNRW